MVPTDFSRSASDALAFVKTIPGIKEIVLLHVVSRAESEKDIEIYLKTAGKKLEDIKKELIDTGADIKFHVVAGDPTEMILSFADEDDVSLIAMSAFGLDWIRGLVLGSTTFTVVRRTKNQFSSFGPDRKTKPADFLSGALRAPNPGGVFSRLMHRMLTEYSIHSS